jgi:UrcA family protein
MRTITILVLTAALTSLAGVASAEDLQTISVPVSQADLQSPEAVAGLYERVEDAAEELCSVTNRLPTSTFSSCMRTVLGEAIERADLAPLAAYAATLQSGHATPVEIASR